MLAHAPRFAVVPDHLLRRRRLLVELHRRAGLRAVVHRVPDAHEGQLSEACGYVGARINARRCLRPPPAGTGTMITFASEEDAAGLYYG